MSGLVVHGLLRMRYLFLLMLIVCGCGAYGQTRRGLVVGVGEYRDRAWSRIHGDRDVPVVREMLRLCDYTDVSSLTNNEATKAAITEAFHSLAGRCKNGDVVYIHFSGHGQQVTDVSGDEDDGWDEAWVPYDAMYAYSESYKGENHLLDDEIAALLAEIKSRVGPSGRILVVVDACHSGDSDRGSADSEEVYVRGASDDFVIPVTSTLRKTAKPKADWLTVTACTNVQNNCELRTKEGCYYGMLTYALFSNLYEIRGLDNQKVLRGLQRYVNLNRKRGRQTVTLSGDHLLAGFFK